MLPVAVNHHLRDPKRICTNVRSIATIAMTLPANPHAEGAIENISARPSRGRTARRQKYRGPCRCP